MKKKDVLAYVKKNKIDLFGYKLLSTNELNTLRSYDVVKLFVSYNKSIKVYDCQYGYKVDNDKGSVYYFTLGPRKIWVDPSKNNAVCFKKFNAVDLLQMLIDNNVLSAPGKRRSKK